MSHTTVTVARGGRGDGEEASVPRAKRSRVDEEDELEDGEVTDLCFERLRFVGRAKEDATRLAPVLPFAADLESTLMERERPLLETGADALRLQTALSTVSAALLQFSTQHGFHRDIAALAHATSLCVRLWLARDHSIDAVGIATCASIAGKMESIGFQYSSFSGAEHFGITVDRVRKTELRVFKKLEFDANAITHIHFLVPFCRVANMDRDTYMKAKYIAVVLSCVVQAFMFRPSTVCAAIVWLALGKRPSFLRYLDLEGTVAPCATVLRDLVIVRSIDMHVETQRRFRGRVTPWLASVAKVALP